MDVPQLPKSWPAPQVPAGPTTPPAPKETPLRPQPYRRDPAWLEELQKTPLPEWEPLHNVHHLPTPAEHALGFHEQQKSRPNRRLFQDNNRSWGPTEADWNPNVCNEKAYHGNKTDITVLFLVLDSKKRVNNHPSSDFQAFYIFSNFSYDTEILAAGNKRKTCRLSRDGSLSVKY